MKYKSKNVLKINSKISLFGIFFIIFLILSTALIVSQTFTGGNNYDANYNSNYNNPNSNYNYNTPYYNSNYNAQQGSFTGGSYNYNNYNSNYNNNYGSNGYPNTYSSEYTGGSFTGGSSYSGNYYNGNGYSSGYNSFSGGYGGAYNGQYSDPNYGSYNSYTSPGFFWPDFNMDDCRARQDILVQIVPGSCSPAVVRSDLLEEQNVPVFCKLMSMQYNPLIDVTRVRSIHFSGQYPKGVSGISYFPARVALRNQRSIAERSLISSPVNPDLGYMVIVLSRQPIEKDMPEFIDGNITATIDYDSEGAFGIGMTNFYMTQMNDETWAREYKDYGFWNGKGYIRAESITQDSAVISIYQDFNTRAESITLRQGETSRDIYLNGFYCGAGLNVQLEKLAVPVESALLQVNDEQIWVSKGDRILNDKCRIVDLSILGSGGKVSVSCPTKDGNFNLILNPGKARFKIGELSTEVMMGEKIDNRNIYLAYLSQDINNKRYAVLVRDEFSISKYEFDDKQVYETILNSVDGKNDNIDKLKEIIKKIVIDSYVSKIPGISLNEINQKVEVQVIEENSGAFGLVLEEVLVAIDKEWNKEDNTQGSELGYEYYKKAITNYEDLADLYPNEKRISEEDPYAAYGLYEAARLSRNYGMNAKAQELYDLIISKYPESKNANIVRNERTFLNRYDTTKSRNSIVLNNEQFTIEVLNFKKPNKNDANAIFLINGKEESMGIKDTRRFDGVNESKTITLELIENEYVMIKYDRTLNGTILPPRTERVGINPENRQISLDGLNVKLMKINLNKQAKLVIRPKTFGTRAQTSFRFKVGIEKRAIQLSPERTKEMMKNLANAMKQWSDINNKLGKVIKAMKAACFATSAVLTVKNYLDGMTGESIARNTIMTASGGWNDICERLVNEKKFYSLQQCLLSKNKEIQDDVKIYSDKVQETNRIMQEIQKEVGIKQTDFLDFTGQTDSKQVEEKFKVKFDEFCKSAQGTVNLPDSSRTNVSFNGPNGVCSWEGLTHEQRRDIYTMYKIREAGGSDVLNGIANKELGNVALSAKNYYETNSARLKAENDAKKYNLDVRTITPVGDSYTLGEVKSILKSDSTHSVYKNFNEGANIIRVFIPFRKTFGNTDFVALGGIGGREVIVEMRQVNGAPGSFTPNVQNGTLKVLTVDGTLVTGDALKSVQEYLSLSGLDRVKELNQKSYHNPMQDPTRLMVKYFDRAPYKGLPSEIPFDINEGWYVELTYILSGFGKPYDESGRVVNFYICNVGENGLIEFKKSADDICRYYNVDTGADPGFPGMTPAESRILITRAQQAIQDASKQYGKERITINGKTFQSGISLGGNEGKCTDFMSPQDCNIMFNVCDPVICPASRCDLGGQYRVDDVIQSGVLGSLSLCLPNLKEGVMIPICLTGVHAGIESYISILNSTVQCLNESLITGRNVGVCDEIKSIYLCEFFWKQAAPFLNVIIPRVFESMYNQGVRGGGEYLTVKGAWDNTQKAVSYFTDTYAINSMKAFSGRNSEDVGTDICKSFVSFNVPGGKDFFSRLIEPDSPVQFTAWFSEDVMTTATIPPTSHYKVYYHIYAGKDMGSTYVVYLKDSPKLDYVNTMGSYIVARGYVSRGGQADEARDFTAPSGFKQLCISVNGKDECGFGKVSTSYLLNSITDSYAEEQLKTGITSEKECVAGSPSIYSLAQPNLQSGVEDVINPELYNSGIIRVCSSENPGKQVLSNGEYDPTKSVYDKWKEVGYCDDRTIKCWLDTDSAKNVIKNKQIEENTLGNINLKMLGEEDYLGDIESINIANQAEQELKNLIIQTTDDKTIIEGKINPIANSLTRLVNIGSNNIHRARGQYLLANLYRKVAESLISKTSNNGDLVTYSSELLAETNTANEIIGDNFEETGITPQPSINEPVSENQIIEEGISYTDEILKKDVKIRLNFKNFFGSLSSTRIYRFDSRTNRWVSNDDNFDSKVSYVDGIRKLAETTGNGDEIVIERGSQDLVSIKNSLIESDNTLSNKIFQVLNKMYKDSQTA